MARFDIHIDVYDPKAGRTVWSGNYSHDEPIGSKTVTAVVEALDKNVRAGMQQLTSEMGQYFAEHPPAPPSAGRQVTALPSQSFHLFKIPVPF